MCIFHKWTKWEQYQLDSNRIDKYGKRQTIAIERRERKHCEKCNTERDRRISFTM